MLIHKSLESIKEHTLVKTVCMPNLQQDIHQRGRIDESSNR